MAVGLQKLNEKYCLLLEIEEILEEILRKRQKTGTEDIDKKPKEQ